VRRNAAPFYKDYENNKLTSKRLRKISRKRRPDGGSYFASSGTVQETNYQSAQTPPDCQAIEKEKPMNADYFKQNPETAKAIESLRVEAIRRNSKMSKRKAAIISTLILLKQGNERPNV
jgi:hypothetical protein